MAGNTTVTGLTTEEVDIGSTPVKLVGTGKDITCYEVKGSSSVSTTTVITGSVTDKSVVGWHLSTIDGAAGSTVKFSYKWRTGTDTTATTYTPTFGLEKGMDCIMDILAYNLPYFTGVSGTTVQMVTGTTGNQVGGYLYYMT